MDNPVVIAVVTALLVALSAFFVAAEFALLGAKRHRLQDAAATSRSARAALRSADELTLLLAGSQLGITACALALGAITKPAVNYALTPLFADWGAPGWVASAGGFVLALVVVTFLHLVVGEMAPKSWAIAHPETSATLLAVPMRGFMWFFRPLLVALNAAANGCLRRVGVEPQDSVASGQTPDDLRQLVEHSASVGALDLAYSGQLTSALDLTGLTVGDLVRWDRAPTAVGPDADVAQVRAAALASGHLRILLRESGPAAPVTGVVHVRDTLALDAAAPAAPVARTPYVLAAGVAVHEALESMRATRQHLAVVSDDAGRVGVVTLEDALRRLLTRPTTA